MRKRIVLAVLCIALASESFGATLNVNASANYQLKTADQWSAIGVPQPTFQWYPAWNSGSLDLTGYGSTATSLTVGNSPDPSEGILDDGQSSSSFNGTNDYLYVNDGTQMRPGAGDFSLLCWARFPSPVVGTGRILASKFNFDANNREYVMSVQPDPFVHSLDAQITADGSTTSQLKIGTTVLDDGKWHLAGFSFVGDSIYLYIDGNRDTPSFVSGSPITSITPGTAKFTIGTYSDSNSRFFNGAMAWCAYWGSGLTDAQMLSIYTYTRPAGSSSLPFPSIQSAIRQASASDVISVASGRYQETVDITKALTIRAADITAFPRPILYGSVLPAAAGVNALTNISGAAANVSYLDIIGYSAGKAIRDSATAVGSLWHHITTDSCGIGYYAEEVVNQASVLYSTFDCENLASSKGLQTVNAGSARTLTLTDCIFTRCGTGSIQGTNWTVTEDYCDYYGNSTDRTSVSAGAHSYSGATAIVPQFFDQPNDNYRLKASSLLRRRGANAGSLGFLYIGAYPAVPSSGFGVNTGFGRSNRAWARGSWAR